MIVYIGVYVSECSALRRFPSTMGRSNGAASCNIFLLFSFAESARGIYAAIL